MVREQKYKGKPAILVLTSFPTAHRRLYSGVGRTCRKMKKFCRAGMTRYL